MSVNRAVFFHTDFLMPLLVMEQRVKRWHSSGCRVPVGYTECGAAHHALQWGMQDGV